MVVFLYITTLSIAYGSLFGLLTQPDELLSRFTRYVNESNWSFYAKKIICPYCVAGQLSLWLSIVYLSVNGWKVNDVIALSMTPACSVLGTYFIVKKWFR